MTDNIFNPELNHNLPSHLRKALGNLKIACKEIDIIKQVCSKLGISYNCPGYVDDTAVHITFPDYKYGIALKSNTSTNNKRSLAFTRAGWRLAIIDATSIATMSFDMLVAHLKAAIETIKREKLRVR